MPTAQNELAMLRTLKTPGDDSTGLLAVFGHADATGDTALNKVLSGRRALAIYALLTRTAELWDELHQEPKAGDRWGMESLQIMLRRCGYEAGVADGKWSSAFKGGVEAFQRDHGLGVSGETDGATRKALFAEYMDALCVDGDGEPFAYAKEDFLGLGQSGDLRRAVQGCGELNPARVVSEAEAKRFEERAHAEERDQENGVNRRVLVFVFPKSAEGADWPCPSAREGDAKCRAVLWSDQEQRRSPTKKRREVRLRGRTFGCQFYDGVARLSPCESLRGTLKVWLLDEHHRRMPGAPYLLRCSGEPRIGRANGDGLLVEANVFLGAGAHLSWGEAPLGRLRASTELAVLGGDGALWNLFGPPPPTSEDHYRFRAPLDLRLDDSAEEALEHEYDLRLHHLGYPRVGTLEDRVAAFRREYGVTAGGTFDAEVRDALYGAHRSGRTLREPAPIEARGPVPEELDGIGCNEDTWLDRAASEE